MTLAEATALYQAQLEGVRNLHPFDDDEIQAQMREDLRKAKALMEIAWLEQHAT